MTDFSLLLWPAFALLAFINPSLAAKASTQCTTSYRSTSLGHAPGTTYITSSTKKCKKTSTTVVTRSFTQSGTDSTVVTTVTSTHTDPTSVSTATETETSFVTRTAAPSTTTVTQDETEIAVKRTTVPTPDGFQGVLNMEHGAYCDSDVCAGAKRRTRRASVEDEQSNIERRARFPQSVTCTVQACKSATKTIISRTTTTLQGTTATQISTESTTTTPSASTTITITEIQTTFVPNSETKTASTTVTHVSISTSTQYQACSTEYPYNYANAGRKGPVNGWSDPNGSLTGTKVVKADRPETCCNAAVQDNAGAVWLFDGTNCLILEDNNCPNDFGSTGEGYFRLTFGEGTQYVVGNAYCGAYYNDGDDDDDHPPPPPDDPEDEE